MILQAGQVRRYHTKPMANPQTIADHTWGVMIILDQIYDKLPPTNEKLMSLTKVLRYALYHDVAEYVTGDSPYTAKRLLGKAFQKLEAKAEKFLGINKLIPELDASDMTYFKIADMFELMHFCTEQIKQGNRNFVDIYFNGYAYISNVIDAFGCRIVSAMLDELKTAFLEVYELSNREFCLKIEEIQDKISKNEFLI